VVGYAGARDPHPHDPHPADDGAFLADIESGEARLIVSIERVYRLLVERHPELRERHMWFNHVAFNRSGTRFFFLARTRQPDGSLETGMFTADLDGGRLVEAIPYGSGVSHFDWRNDREIVATFRLDPEGPRRAHVLFTDGERDYRALGAGVLQDDGHCCFSADGAWLVTDQNHRATLEKSLWLLHVESGRCVELGRYPMFEVRYLRGDTRCDLHPRWSRDGTQICIDAIEPRSRTRQLHVVQLRGGPGGV